MYFMWLRQNKSMNEYGNIHIIWAFLFLRIYSPMPFLSPCLLHTSVNNNSLKDQKVESKVHVS